MKRLASALARQFGRPKGLLGGLAGWIMANRSSNRERNLKTLEVLGIEPGDRVLELGFGPGFALAEASRLAHRGRVEGIDHSEVMVSQASRRNAEAIARGHVELRLASAESADFPPDSIDKAYAVNVMMFWSDPVAVLSRLRRTLRPRGRIAITHQPRNPGASDADAERGAERIRAALQAAGFDEIRVEMLPMRPVSAACVVGTRRRSA